MKREACVCDHGYERSDLCAEIIIIIIIIIKKTQRKSNTCEKHMIQVPKSNRFRKTRSRLG